MDYSIIAVYMLVVIGVGFFFTNKKETTENYLLGGRNMNSVAIGISMMMSLMSSISIVQIPGEIFNFSWTLFSLSWLSLSLQIPAYLLFARFYFKLGSFTPYEYLERRYDPYVRGIVAISAFYVRVMYLGMVLYTTSKIFEGGYGWPSWLTILLVGVVGVLYTVLGGMKAVVWTDVIQFFVLYGGFFMLLVVLNSKIDGGLLGAIIYSHETGHLAPQYATKEFYELTPYVRLCFWLMLWSALISPLNGISSDQINVQRILSTKGWRAGLRSQSISSMLGLLSVAILYVIGFAIYTYYSKNPDPIVSSQGGDIALFRFIATEMPAPIPGIFMAAMLAAIMSTLDSGINSMATVWLKEFHSKFINRHLTPAQEVSVSRWATFIVGAFAILLGLGIEVSGRWLRQSVTEVGTIFAMLGAASMPAFLTAVLTKRANATLIWAYTFFGFGEAVAKSVWYALSRAAEQAWNADPSVGLGWGGKLDLVYFITPLIVGIVLCVPWLIQRRGKRSVLAKISALLGCSALGIACGNAMWYFYSQALVTDVPLARSFAFYLPVSLIGVFIIVWFCPVQPERKWRGLTLATVGDPIPDADEPSREEK